MAKSYFKLHYDFLDIVEPLTMEERGRLVWAMLAHARGEDPAPHLTGALRKYSFPNERDLIDRTEKVHVERKERRRAVAMMGVAARTNGNQRSPTVTDGHHNHNNNNNYNNNYNHNNNYNNNNNDNKGGSARTHGKDRRSEAGRTVPIGRETIL